VSVKLTQKPLNTVEIANSTIYLIRPPGYAIRAIESKMISLARMRNAKGFTRRLYAANFPHYKLPHFQGEIFDAKILHFDLGAKDPGVSALEHTSLVIRKLI